MKIRSKVMIGLTILIVLIIGMGSVAYIQNNKTQQQYTSVIQQEIKVQTLLKNIQYRSTGISNDQRAYLLTGDQEFIDSIAEKNTEILNNIAEIKKITTNADILKALTTLEEGISAYINVGEEVRAAYKENKQNALKLHMGAERDIRKEQTDPAIKDIIALLDKKIAARTAEIEQSNKTTDLLVIILTMSAIIIGIIIISLIRRALKPLSQLQDSVHIVANGDLTAFIPVTTKDEVGDLATSINKMIETLRTTITNVYDSSHQVASSAEELSANAAQSTEAIGQIAHISEHLVVSTEKQMEKFISMTKIVHDLSTDISELYSNEEVMSNLSQTAKKAAAQGHTGMQTIITEMEMISASVEGTSKIIHGLEDKSTAIENIVAIISNLAEQTNLLALNAAIEAARAGEHGKGFAVVADEVRKLAEESKKSADSVRQVIGEIQQETVIAVKSMDSGLEKVKSGITSTNEVNETFQTIESAISQLSEKVLDIATSLRDMNSLNNKVVNYVSEVKDLAEANTLSTQESLATTEEQLATSEEISSASDTLAKLADEQKSIVSQFKI